MRVREQARTRDALRPSMERGDLTKHVIIQDKQKNTECKRTYKKVLERTRETWNQRKTHPRGYTGMGVRAKT